MFFRPTSTGETTRVPSVLEGFEGHGAGPKDDVRFGREASPASDKDMNEECPLTTQQTLDKPQQRSTACSVLLVLTCTLAMMLNISATSSTSISLPSVGRAFHVPEDKLQWAASSYSLSSGCLLIFFGRLADIYGRKKAFLLGAFWLGIFSLGNGFTQNMLTLDILRGLQGMGSAAMVPASIGILAHAFPPSRARSLAFATFSAGAPIGGAVGLQIGGILTQYTPATWRSPYFLISGLTAIVIVGGCFFIDADKPSVVDKRVDWLGALLITGSLVLITFVLGDGETAPQRWQTPYIIALLVVGVLLLGAFLAWEYYLESDTTGARCPPLMKLSMWKRANGKFAAVQWIAFLEWAAFMGWSFWAQLYYQDFESFSPVQTSLRLLPMFVVGIICNLVIAAVVGRVPVVILVLCGTLLTGTAGLLFALIDPNAPYWAFGFPASVSIVFGADFVFSCGTLFVARVSALEEQSLAGGLFQTLTQLGTALGLATTTIVHNTILRNAGVGGAGLDRQNLLKAYQGAQWLVFGFAALGSVIAIVWLRGVGPIGQSGGSPPPVPPKDSSWRFSEYEEGKNARTAVGSGAQTPAKEKGVEEEEDEDENAKTLVQSMRYRNLVASMREEEKAMYESAYYGERDGSGSYGAGEGMGMVVGVDMTREVSGEFMMVQRPHSYARRPPHPYAHSYPYPRPLPQPRPRQIVSLLSQAYSDHRASASPSERTAVQSYYENEGDAGKKGKGLDAEGETDGWKRRKSFEVEGGAEGTRTSFTESAIRQDPRMWPGIRRVDG